MPPFFFCFPFFPASPLSSLSLPLSSPHHFFFPEFRHWCHFGSPFPGHLEMDVLLLAELNTCSHICASTYLYVDKFEFSLWAVRHLQDHSLTHSVVPMVICRYDKKSPATYSKAPCVCLYWHHDTGYGGWWVISFLMPQEKLMFPFTENDAWKMVFQCRTVWVICSTEKWGWKRLRHTLT